MTQSQVNDVKNKALAQKSKGFMELVEEYADQLGDSLPSHMSKTRMVRIAATTFRLNPKLGVCNPLTILGALFQAAQLGLEPNVEGQCYIIPYKVKRKGTNIYEDVAQFQIGYKGYVELFWRHQSALSLQMETVYKGDNFTFDLGKNELTHTRDMEKDDRGPVIAYYASAQLKGGGRVVKVVSKKEALDHAKRFSKCWDAKRGEFRFGTPWREHFDAMALKTVLIKLMKVLPKSIEIQHAIAMDETVKSKVIKKMIDIPNEDDFQPEPEATGQLPAPAESTAPADSPEITGQDQAPDPSGKGGENV